MKFIEVVNGWSLFPEFWKSYLIMPIDIKFENNLMKIYLLGFEFNFKICEHKYYAGYVSMWSVALMYKLKVIITILTTKPYYQAIDEEKTVIHFFGFLFFFTAKNHG